MRAGSDIRFTQQPCTIRFEMTSLQNSKSDSLLVGLTYDLRQDYLDAGYSDEQTAEFDRLDTIEAIEYVLHQMGHQADRIGRVTTLVERLARGDRWDMVFNIAEGLHGIGRESQVPALLDAYEIPYTFSDPLVCAMTLHKGMAKRIVRDLGLPTAKFVVVENEHDITHATHPSTGASASQATCCASRFLPNLLRKARAKV